MYMQLYMYGRGCLCVFMNPEMMRKSFWRAFVLYA